jgi:hypothetical protein
MKLPELGISRAFMLLAIGLSVVAVSPPDKYSPIIPFEISPV